MSDFLTLLANTALAQTALGSAMVVQPRLASRFEGVRASEMNDVEMTDSSPSPLETLPPARHLLPVSQPREDHRETSSPPARDKLAVQRPNISEHSLEYETNHPVTRDNHSPSFFKTSINTRVVEQNLLPQTPVAIQADRAKTQSPLTLTEPREKEIEKEILREVHSQNSPQKTLETVTKEKLSPVVQREVSKLELPETPLLQPALAPSVLKPEVTATPTPTPTVQVTIGRLEIRTPPQQKTVLQASKPTGVMSLEDYRRKRGLE